MDLALKILYQVIIIFIYMSVGFVLSKTKKLKSAGVKDITNVLLTVVTPCVLISSYQQKIDEFSFTVLKGLGIAALFTVIVHIAAIIIATLFYKNDGKEKYKVNRFAAVYSNCGFMAIPILSSVLGADGVFYGSIYLAIFTFFYWTHGVLVFSSSKSSVSLKSLFLNAGVIGTFAALTLFILKIRLPDILFDAVYGISGLNTPLSMIVLGTYLANVNWKQAFSKASLYTVSFLRLFVLPLISIFIIMAIRLIVPVNSLIAQAVLIPAACPVAGVTALFAAKYGSDATYASELVAITTLFSIITLPIIMVISTYFIN